MVKMFCASRAVEKLGMPLAVVEEGFAGKLGEVQELAGRVGSLGAISREVGCSGVIFIDNRSCTAKSQIPILLQWLRH